MTTTTTHPALLKAQEIHDRRGDLAPNEQVFLLAVHFIGKNCTETKREAIRAYGYGSSASTSTAFLANCKEADDLAKALHAFEASLEDRDTEAFPFELAAE
jgi:hypothetical protein